MSATSRLKQSRRQWKEKAITRGNSERYQRKELRRLKQERDHYKKAAREAQNQLAQERQKKPSLAVRSKEELVFIALQLFVVARIGFRAVSRVLEVLGSHLGWAKAPCPQTLINWVIRLSMVKIHNASQWVGPRIDGNPCAKGLIWMIDTSIGLGSGKILVVLALQAQHHRLNEGAPTLGQVQCLAVSVASSWTGEAIADFLQQVITRTATPLAYLKDGGTDLAKATRVLSERGYPSVCIDDLSHTIANLLKHDYQDHPQFSAFISACGQASKKLKQTVLACLAPPKVSTKARFMNLHRLVRWADALLKHCPKGRASAGSPLSKLRASLDHMPHCKAFIGRFLRDATALLACQKILKNQGLSQTSYRECQPFLETIPVRSAVRIGFTSWAEAHLKLAADLNLDKVGLPISSDTIESLFGVSKQHGTGELKDANRIALRIPAMCGELTREEAQRVLSIRVKEQQELLDSFPSLTQQRRQILSNPGSLDTLQVDEQKHNLALIPGTKNQLKNSISYCITKDYEIIMGPFSTLGKPLNSPLSIELVEAATA
jgi:hypothetical protein